MLCRYISCKTVQKDLSPLKNKLPRDIYKENYKISIRGYSSLSPNLITKESYNWWVTRRFWGFRQQISKAKYLKISIAKYLQVSVAYIWKLQENTAALCRNGCKTLRVNAIRRSGYAWPGKLKRLLSHPASSAGCETSGWNVPDVRHPGGMAARSPIRMKVPDVRHLGGMAARSPYPDSLPQLTRHFDGVSGRPMPWIPKNSPQSWIALVIKKLSKHQNLTQFD